MKRPADVSGEQVALLLRKLKKRKGKPEQGTGTVEAIPRSDRTRPLPLSFSQERLWLLDRLETSREVYNLAFPARIKGELDPGICQGRDRRDPPSPRVSAHHLQRTGRPSGAGGGPT